MTAVSIVSYRIILYHDIPHHSVLTTALGAGEDFFEATYQPQRQGKLQELDTLSSVVADDRARLNAVAMFFLKRSFPHVR